MIATPVLHPKTLDLLMEFEGKPRLVARLCEGGRYEVAYGVTYYLDGTPVKAGDRITEDQVMPLTLNALAKEGKPVWDKLTREPTPAQAGAMAVMAFNVGGSAAAGSSVVRYFNEGRFEDAAASFGMWTGATSSGPSPTEIAAGIAPKFPTWDRNTGRWLSPEGKPCAYFRRFRGLLRRHHATGCFSLGLDWTEATKNDAVSMATEAVWNAAKGRWEDKIIRQTEFPEVLAIASRYPLQALPSPIPSEPDPPKVPAPVIPVEAAPLPEVVPTPPPVEKPVSVPPKPPTVSTGSLPNDFDPDDGMKAMIYSRRFWGWLLIVLGRLSFITDGGSHALAQAGGAVGSVANAVASDPMLLDMYTGMSVMFVGEAVRWWGEKKATRPLK